MTDAPPRNIAALIATLNRATPASANQPKDAAPDLEPILPHLSDLPAGALLTVLRQAEQQGHNRAMVALLDEVARREVIPGELALALLRRAHDLVDPATARRVQDFLAARMGPRRQQDFVQSATLLRDGPLAALAVARQRHGGPRTAHEAADLADLLQQAGRKRLARRYLRMAQRRWPNNRRIRNQLFDAHLQLSDVDAAEALVAHVARTWRPSDLDGFRMPLVIEATGTRPEAIAALEALVARKPNGGYDRQLALMHIAEGNLDAAAQVVDRLRASGGFVQRVAAHFSVTHLGVLLNELRIYRLSCPTTDTDERPDRDLAAAFFHPASRILDLWSDQIGNRPAALENTIPRRVVQYWNMPDPGPEMTAIMNSWAGHPGWHYQRYDRAGALTWLRERCGRDHARAFQMAHHVAQESDFFRLCVLAVEGGIYADSDDMLIGDIEAFRDLGTGLVLFREPFGGISNNLMLARAGHPAIERAVEMACASLLARENDSTWTKTGPGLVTRALALHLDDSWDKAAGDVTLLRRHAWGPFVKAHMRLPHKSTSRYWNTELAGADAALRTAFGKLG